MHQYTTVDARPELKKNILNFGYGINSKYIGMLLHSIDRFHIVTKLIYPNTDDIGISSISFDMNCSYVNVQLCNRIHASCGSLSSASELV